MTSTAMDRPGWPVVSQRRRLADLARLELGFEDTWFVRQLRGYLHSLHTPRGMLSFALAIALTCGVLVHERCLAVAGVLCVVIGTGTYLPGVIAGNARVRLNFETERATEDDEIALNVRIEPREAIPLVGLTIDTGASFANVRANASDRWHFVLPTIWPWKRTMLRRQVRRQVNRRGCYRLDQATVMCSFPFRLREARAHVASDGMLIVWPKIYPISKWPEVTIGSDDYGQMMSPAKGTSGDTTGLREFRRGDDPRRIHWPQTARLGQLVMREQQRSTNPRMCVHLDSPAQFETWESDWAVRLAASFLAGAERMGWQCDLELGDDDSHDRRVFHGHDTGFYLDRLAAFGDAESLTMIESDAASDEIPRERLRLSIVSARSALPSAGSQAVVVLGEPSSDFHSTEHVWLHFANESDVIAWLDAGRGES